MDEFSQNIVDQVLGSTVGKYLPNLFSDNQKFGSDTAKKPTDFLSRTNLSNKRESNFYQQVERNDYAAFLMESGNFYKSNRFFCAVFPPAIKQVMEYYNKDKSGFRFNIEAVSIPEQTIETFDYKLGNNNPTVKMPFNMSYGDGTITLTFRMGKRGKVDDFLERKIFLTWQEAIFSFNKKNGNLPGASYYDEYCANSAIILSQIDTANNRIYNTIFTNVYPISVGGIEYSWNPTDDYVRQNVTFAFSRMFSEGTKPAEEGV